MCSAHQRTPLHIPEGSSGRQSCCARTVLKHLHVPIRSLHLPAAHADRYTALPKQPRLPLSSSDQRLLCGNDDQLKNIDATSHATRFHNCRRNILRQHEALCCLSSLRFLLREHFCLDISRHHAGNCHPLISGIQTHLPAQCQQCSLAGCVVCRACGIRGWSGPQTLSYTI